MDKGVIHKMYVLYISLINIFKNLKYQNFEVMLMNITNTM